MMKKIRNEHLLYLLAFLLALGLRLANLGKAPLSDFEAGWALQSLALARGETVTLGALPGYIFPTTLLFFLAESTNFVARFWPALAGSLLVLAPFAFREKLGQRAALIIAFGLAIDPGMMALSRLAGGPMLAIAFTMLAWAFLYRRRYAWGGVAAGLALISGPAVITGCLGLAVAYGLARLLGVFRDDDILPDGHPTQNSHWPSRADWLQVLIFGAGTLLIVSTLLFRFPQGLAAWSDTLSAYLQSWTQNAGIPAGRLLAALFFYAILALVFGLVAVIRAWVQKQKAARFLSLWLLAALALPLLMAGRQVGDIAWSLLPLWALAGLEISRSARRQEPRWVSLGQAAVVVVLLIIIWLTLAALDTALPENISSYWLVAGAALLIGVLVTVLIYMGWSWQAARTGLVWGLVVGLGAYTLASALGVSQVHPNTPQEWWVPTPTTRQAGLLADTLKDLALAQTGHADYLDIVSLVDVPSLRWVLRNITHVDYVTSLSPETTPLIVITRADDSSGLRQELYRGQDFGWWESPGWGGALPWEPIKWLTSRQAPTIVENVVLWARLDLFPEDLQTSKDAEPDLGIDESSPPADEGVDVEE